MREHKYRAWDKVNKKMVTHFSLNFTNLDGYTKWSFLTDDIGYCNVNNCKISPRSGSDDLIFMQDTGLKDKNGVKISEKDIVTKYNIKMIKGDDYEWIDWCNDCLSYQFFFCYHDGADIKDLCHSCEGNYSLIDFDRSGLEVIGNIYENPELLK